MKIAAAATLAAVLSIGGAVNTAPGSDPAGRADPLLAAGYGFAYNMDYPEALKCFEDAIRARPKSPETYRGLATLTWLYILFQRGVVTVDDYMGRLSRSDVQVPAIPPAEAARFRANIDRALALSEEILARNPKSAQAHYDVGATVGLMATYTASVEGRVMGGLRSAKRAYTEQEETLSIDPRRKDAGLIVGTYRYIVANLPLPVRMLAYVVGFGGDKELGIRMLEDAARYPGDSQADARFALVLFYNREERWADGLRVIRDLRAEFPRNRLLWLEAGATALRGGRAAEAEAELTAGIDRLRGDSRPRSFGEEPLWYYKRGAARVLLGNAGGAEADLRRALEGKGRDWIRGRIHLELGKVADLTGNRSRARSEYQAAMGIANQAKDEAGVEQATALLQVPYRKR